MKTVGKRKGDKANQATSNEAAQRQNLRGEVYRSADSGREHFADVVLSGKKAMIAVVRKL